MAERVGIRFTKNLLTKRLRDRYDRAKNTRPAMLAAVRLMRESVALEFALESYFSPGGGIIPWKRRVTFGNKPGGPLLQRSLAYMRDWLGIGPGSVTVATQQTAGIGVRGERSTRLAEIHRGGLGRNPRIGKVTTVKALEAVENSDRISSRSPHFWRMYWALREQFNVFVGYAKLRVKGFKIPARPHAAMHPDLRRRIIQATGEWLSGQKAKAGA